MAPDLRWSFSRASFVSQVTAASDPGADCEEYQPPHEIGLYRVKRAFRNATGAAFWTNPDGGFMYHPDGQPGAGDLCPKSVPGREYWSLKYWSLGEDWYAFFHDPF